MGQSVVDILLLLSGLPPNIFNSYRIKIKKRTLLSVSNFRHRLRRHRLRRHRLRRHQVALPAPWSSSGAAAPSS